MNQEIKARWIAALKSGEYIQGTKVLRSVDNRFCCLGVLCELAVKEGVIPASEVKEINTSVRDIKKAYGYDGSAFKLSMSVVNWAELKDQLPLASGPISDGYSLAYLNDTYKYDFHKIAAAIEEGL